MGYKYIYAICCSILGLLGCAIIYNNVIASDIPIFTETGIKIPSNGLIINNDIASVTLQGSTIIHSPNQSLADYNSIFSLEYLSSDYESSFQDTFASQGYNFVIGIHIGSTIPLIFDKPIAITIEVPSYIPEGYMMPFFIKHGGEQVNTIGLSNNPHTLCQADGTAQDSSQLFTVWIDNNMQKKFVTLYSCRASGIAGGVGGGVGSGSNMYCMYDIGMTCTPCQTSGDCPSIPGSGGPTCVSSNMIDIGSNCNGNLDGSTWNCAPGLECSGVNFPGQCIEDSSSSTQTCVSCVEGATCKFNSDCGVGGACVNQICECSNCDPAEGQSCIQYSVPNICGEVASTTGVILCDGTCSVTPPASPIATDTDGDTIADCIDNCIEDYNPGQEDIDHDEIGDVCDDPACGNAILETGEACDDGNTNNTDSCTNACLLPACGDSYVQGTEACDDGNTSNNDGCSASCMIERCGDGILQTGEGCDDGNTSNNDGCSAICVIESCGDEIVQTGEACDDGNMSNTDSCTNACLLPVCGDSYVQGTEACDDGNTSNNDGCSASCMIERCGDGILQTGEGCDDGNTSNNDGCSAICVIESCGDEIVQTGEACDDGNMSNTDSCTNACLLPACGDSYVQGTEACDDGNTSNNDGCSASCMIERCGDGILQTGEGCDDGNTSNNDGCSAICVIESCGDEIVQTGEACDDGNMSNTDSCTNACLLPVCGDSYVQGTEACDDGNTSNNDGCSASCMIERCGDGILQTGEGCDDGNTSNNDGCSAICVIESCGDEIVQTGEACDDGNMSNTDSCTNACLLPVCGDSYVQGTEACDDGNTSNNDGCSASCMIERCGDGILQTGEGCDDGNTSNNDGCSAICVIESCGDEIVQTGEACDDGNMSNTDSCTNACLLPVCGDSYVQGTEACDDGNTSNNDGCSASCMIEICGDGILQTGEGCDDGNTSNNDGCSAICVIESCGDEIVQTGEACDDGNMSNTDSCTNACLLPVCGDSYVQGTEACDDGNTSNNDGCSASCMIERCGDGILQTGEGCDDGNGIAGDGCEDNCQYTCNVNEDCDDGLYCNGMETCDVVNGCQAGIAPVCDDSLYCNGLEICDEGTDSCTNPEDIICDDNLSCTQDACNEETDMCLYQSSSNPITIEITGALTCQQRIITLSIDAGGADTTNRTYLRSNGDTQQSITVTQAGIYSVEVDQGGCIAQANVIIDDICDIQIDKRIVSQQEYNWLGSTYPDTISEGIGQPVANGSLQQGDWFVYEIMIQNNGLGIATDITIDDILPEGLEVFKIDIGDFDTFVYTPPYLSGSKALLSENEQAKGYLFVKLLSGYQDICNEAKVYQMFDTNLSNNIEQSCIHAAGCDVGVSCEGEIYAENISATGATCIVESTCGYSSSFPAIWMQSGSLSWYECRKPTCYGNLIRTYLETNGSYISTPNGNAIVDSWGNPVGPINIHYDSGICGSCDGNGEACQGGGCEEDCSEDGVCQLDCPVGSDPDCKLACSESGCVNAMSGYDTLALCQQNCGENGCIEPLIFNPLTGICEEDCSEDGVCQLDCPVGSDPDCKLACSESGCVNAMSGYDTLALCQQNCGENGCIEPLIFNPLTGICEEDCSEDGVCQLDCPVGSDPDCKLACSESGCVNAMSGYDTLALCQQNCGENGCIEPLIFNPLTGICEEDCSTNSICNILCPVGSDLDCNSTPQLPICAIPPHSYDYYQKRTNKQLPFTGSLCEIGIASGFLYTGGGSGGGYWSRTCSTPMASIACIAGHQYCGDGIVNPGEECDDGNTIGTDACDNRCRFFDSDLTINFCGDGVAQQPNNEGIMELCDDGNWIDGDGCNSLCEIEGCILDSECNDNNICNGIEYCVGGSCAGGTGVIMNDNNSCTIDSCNPIVGVLHSPVLVNDNNSCTIDSCDPLLGITHSNSCSCNQDSECNDNNICNGIEYCVGGSCAGGTGVIIDDNNSCTIDSCDPLLGVTHTPVPIDDYDICTVDSCLPLTGVMHINNNCSHETMMYCNIDGYVYEDKNQNKLFDSDERVFSGVEILGAGRVTQTNSDGYYIISGVQCTGYVLHYITPNGYDMDSAQYEYSSQQILISSIVIPKMTFLSTISDLFSRQNNFGVRTKSLPPYNPPLGGPEKRPREPPKPDVLPIFHHTAAVPIKKRAIQERLQTLILDPISEILPDILPKTGGEEGIQ